MRPVRARPEPARRAHRVRGAPPPHQHRAGAWRSTGCACSSSSRPSTRRSTSSRPRPSRTARSSPTCRRARAATPTHRARHPHGLAPMRFAALSPSRSTGAASRDRARSRGAPARRTGRRSAAPRPSAGRRADVALPASRLPSVHRPRRRSSATRAAPLRPQGPRRRRSWAPSARSAQTVRVDIHKLDHLMNIVGELVHRAHRRSRASSTGCAPQHVERRAGRRSCSGCSAPSSDTWRPCSKASSRCAWCRSARCSTSWRGWCARSAARPTSSSTWSSPAPRPRSTSSSSRSSATR